MSRRMSLEGKAAQLNFMFQALCLRNPGVCALRPRVTPVKTEYWQGVCVYTNEGPLRIHSRAAISANRFWIATTLKHMAAEKRAEKRAEQLLEESNKRELAKRYAAVWR